MVQPPGAPRAAAKRGWSPTSRRTDEARWQGLRLLHSLANEPNPCVPEATIERRRPRSRLDESTRNRAQTQCVGRPEHNQHLFLRVRFQSTHLWSFHPGEAHWLIRLATADSRSKKVGSRWMSRRNCGWWSRPEWTLGLPRALHRDGVAMRGRPTPRQTAKHRSPRLSEHPIRRGHAAS